MSYIDQFIDSLKFLTKINKQYRKTNPNFSKIKDEILLHWNERNNETSLKGKELIEKIAYLYIENRKESVINKCHVVSHDLYESVKSFGIHNELNITIGNVYHKKCNIYNLSKGKLKIIINQGKLLYEKIDVHVWLTSMDMTVFDLTIMPTLAKMERIELSEAEENPVLVWREDIPSDFHYEPLLVDNEFLYRVDEIIGKRSL